ncbi:hypothetical protein Q3G72_000377 [Acer saccharum]|nr:hypothetical protein Q3G72_000377 [Acer saccharum]
MLCIIAGFVDYSRQDLRPRYGLYDDPCSQKWGNNQDFQWDYNEVGTISDEEKLVNLITFNRGGKSVKFNGNRPKDRREDGCLVLKFPKSRKKKSQVVDLVRAFEMVTEMEEGNHDCLLEQEAIKLEDEKLAKRTLKEIGELERDNEKLMLEVRVLKAENGLLRKKVQEFSTSNEELGEQIVVLEEKEKVTSKNLEDLAKLSE